MRDLLTDDVTARSHFKDSMVPWESNCSQLTPSQGFERSRLSQLGFAVFSLIWWWEHLTLSRGTGLHMRFSRSGWPWDMVARNEWNVCHRNFGPCIFGPGGPIFSWKLWSGRTDNTGKIGPALKKVVRSIASVPRRCYLASAPVHYSRTTDHQLWELKLWRLGLICVWNTFNCIATRYHYY